jgi:hypothetical protein
MELVSELLGKQLQLCKNTASFENRRDTNSCGEASESCKGFGGIKGASEACLPNHKRDEATATKDYSQTPERVCLSLWRGQGDRP